MGAVKKKIRDLVEVPPVRTVVQLADLRDEALSRELIESFVFTREAEFVLTTFLNQVAEGQGRGFFLEGNFGSGKSHLLSVLSMLLNNTFKNVMSGKELSNEKLGELVGKLGQRDYLVVEVSLVEHSNREYLEDIVIKAVEERLQKKGVLPEDLGDFSAGFTGGAELDVLKELIISRYKEELERFCQEKGIAVEEDPLRNESLLWELIEQLKLPLRVVPDRRRVWKELFRKLEDANLNGLVLLIDELSEFLRSKVSARAFNEDVRFLQFLGEYSARKPLWILATLQESIENTGDLPPGTMDKIKDRYPVRFKLGGTHVKELIFRRLIKKRPGSREYLENLYRAVEDSFGRLPYEFEEFYRLYPVHPATVALLDELRPLFSQHRGVVDFIHFRLAGDSQRQIVSFLDRPADELLGPEQIFLHFRRRLEETMETSAYSRQVYAFYEQEAGQIFPDEDDRKTALRLVAILILAEVSPFQRRFNVRQLARMLLVRITQLDWESNYFYIHGLLDKLYREGSFIGREENEDPLEQKYYIDLQADIRRPLTQRLEQVQKSLFAQDRRLITRLMSWADQPLLPLAELEKSPDTLRQVTWQHTVREGRVLFYPLRELPSILLEEAAQELLAGRPDWLLVIAWPDFTEQLRAVPRLLERLPQRAVDGIVFWMPQTLDDTDLLREALSHQLLLEELREKGYLGRRVVDYLEQRLKKYKPQVARFWQEIYLRGQLISPQGELLLDLSSGGPNDFQGVLESAARMALSSRFPRHPEVAPLVDALTPGALQRTLEHFLLPGEVDKKVDSTTRLVIEKCLIPMGIVQKKGGGFQLVVDPGKSSLVAHALSLVEEERIGRDEFYLKLRKGEFGLGDVQLKLLLLALLCSGVVTGYVAGRQVVLSQLKVSSLDRIEQLGRGQILPERFQELLLQLSILPRKFKKFPFTLALQRETWQWLQDFRREAEEKILRVERCLAGEEDNELLAALDPGKLKQEIQEVSEVIAEIKYSYASQEGLERFLAAHQAHPFWEGRYSRLEKIDVFFREHRDKLQAAYNYLTNPGLELPAGEVYTELKQKREELIASLQEPENLLDENQASQLEKSFESFRDQYIDIYLKEHRRLLGEERLESYSKLRRSRDYKLLSLFDGLNNVKCSNNLQSIEAVIKQVEERICRQCRRQWLYSQPVCPCGFHLGYDPEFPSPAEIHRRIEEGCRQYLETLQQPALKERILSYLEEMESVGREHFARPVRQLLELDPGSPRVLGSMEKLVTRPVIELLNKALEGRALVVERSLDDLLPKLAGRTFTKKQLLQVLDSWLDLPGEDVYIRFQDRDAAADGVKKLEAMVREGYPELVALLEKTGGTLFARVLVLWYWSSCHQLTSPLLPRGVEVPESLQPALAELSEHIFSRERKLAQELVFLVAGDKEISTTCWEALRRHYNFQSEASVLRLVEREEVFLQVLEKLLCYVWRQLEEGAWELERLAAGVSKLEKLEERKAGPAGTRTAEGGVKAPGAGHDSVPAGTRGVLTSFLKKDFLSLLSLLLQVEISLRRLACYRGEEKWQPHRWENIYRQDLGWLEYRMARLEVLLYNLSLVESVPLADLKSRAQRELEQYEKMFKNFYRNRFPLGRPGGQPGNGLITAVGVLERFKQLEEQFSPQESQVILLDACRWDTWQLLREEIERLGLRLLEEGLHWAADPTVTARQLDILGRAEKKAEMNLVAEDSLEYEADFRQGRYDLVHFGFIDDMIHSYYGNYAVLLEQIMTVARSEFFPHLKKLSPRSLLLLFSDHGFSQQREYRFQAKYEGYKYKHGGLTPQEVLAPWAIFWLPG